MITLFDAIYSLNSAIVTIRGDVAYDANEQEVTYDKAQAEAKLQELQEAEMIAWQNKDVAKQSALAKLAALGLTQDEVKALVG
jgi:predicted Holliday junction resolvase-like endonuclease